MGEKVTRKIVSDASKLPTTSDHAEILKQVEFYFSDSNLPTDKFLWEATQKNNGWVSIETIHNFKRMRRFEPFEEVVAALKESPELLEVSEDGQKVRRRKALKEPPSSAKKDAFARTVYAKGFGPEIETSQFDLEKWFGQFGPIKQVRLRRTEDGTFKESVFVEFSNLEDATKFVESKPKFTEDKELLIMFKQAYVEMKAAQQNFTDTATGKRRRPFNAFHNSSSSSKRHRNGHNHHSKKNNKRNPKTESSQAASTEDTKSIEPNETKAPEVAEVAEVAETDKPIEATVEATVDASVAPSA